MPGFGIAEEVLSSRRTDPKTLPVLRDLWFNVNGLARKNHAKAEATSSLRARKLLNRRYASA
jgi:hypothetical protein